METVLFLIILNYYHSRQWRDKLKIIVCADLYCCPQTALADMILPDNEHWHVVYFWNQS